MAAPMMKIFRHNFRSILRYSRTLRASSVPSVYVHIPVVSEVCRVVPLQCNQVGIRCFSSEKDGDHSSDNTSDDDIPNEEEVSLSAKPKNRKEVRKAFKDVHKATLEEKRVKPFSEKIVNAAVEVGNLSPNPDQTVNDLLQRLQTSETQFKTTEDPMAANESIGDLLSGMSTEGRPPPQPFSFGQTFEDSIAGQEEGARKSQHHSIYSGARLNIFDPSIMKQPPTKSLTPFMDKLRQEELEAMANFPPSNAFDEMIKWTKEGKMWHFPIDNEQGLDEEKNTPFTEHVFLDHLIEDFPKKGPIRHFMELVVVGLSKNAYLTVQEKHNQIQWFRDYFKDKMHLVEFEDNQDKIASS